MPIANALAAPLTPAVHAAAARSVLCWLATVDAQGQPNVSPKEVWALLGDCDAVVAHIASPQSAANIRRVEPAPVCLSFVDVWVQKGYKLVGHAREILPQAPEFAHWARPLRAMTGERFELHSVLHLRIHSAHPIVAPSYWRYPDTTTEATQIAAARQRYGV